MSSKLTDFQIIKKLGKCHTPNTNGDCQGDCGTVHLVYPWSFILDRWDDE